MNLAAILALEHVADDVRNAALMCAKVLIRGRRVIHVDTFSVDNAREAAVFKLHHGCSLPDETCCSHHKSSRPTLGNEKRKKKKEKKGKNKGTTTPSSTRLLLHSRLPLHSISFHTRAQHTTLADRWIAAGKTFANCAHFHKQPPATIIMYNKSRTDVIPHVRALSSSSTTYTHICLSR